MKLSDIEMCLYDPKSGHVSDLVHPNGERTVYGKRTIAEAMEAEPQLQHVTTDEAIALCETFARAKYCTGAVQVTAARFWDMLEVLPPCKWRHSSVGGRDLEMFHVSERLTGNLVSWFVADHTHKESTYWELTEDGTATREKLAQCVEVAREAA